ncbi:MAG: Gldg family protein [bacterium]|nr:Gldg family protein [bacterium]
MNLLSRRTLKYGSNALTAILIAAGLMAALNFLTARYHWRYDMTERGLFTLSPKTVSLLENLNEDITVIGFFREAEQADFGRLLTQYAYHSPHFSFRFVDPDKEPLEAKRFKVTNYGSSVIQYGQKEERITEATEKALTNGLSRVTSDLRQAVYFLGGHDEVQLDEDGEKGFKRVNQLLIENNNETRPPLVLAQVEKVPRDCELLVIAGPKRALMPAEIAAISDYLTEGGAALFMLDPLVDSGLEPLLYQWAIGLRNDFIVDNSNVLPGADFSVPVTANYSMHPITDKHSGLMTFFPLTRSVERVGSLPGAEVSALAMSSPRSWSETNLAALKDKNIEAIKYDSGADRPGPLWMSMAVEGPLNFKIPEELKRGPRARLVVFGDSDFATNQFVDVAGNGDLFMNAVSWLLNERDRITIRPKVAHFRPLELAPGDEFWIRWISWLILPAIPILIGIAVWLKRR